MGDRCSINLRFRKCDTKAFEDVFGSFDEDNTELGNGTTSAWFHEVNYGGQSELMVIANNGIPFIGHNEAGDDYGPGRFCSVGGEYHEVEADFDGEPIIKTKNGKIEGNSKNAVKAYMKMEKLAKKALLLPPVNHGPYEIVIKVTLQVDPDDVNKIFTLEGLQDTAKEAVENALNLVEGAGFSHTLANEVSIGVKSIEIGAE